MTGLFMFNVFDFFFQIKRIMKVLKNIFNRDIDVFNRNQKYSMRILHDPLPCYAT